MTEKRNRNQNADTVMEKNYSETTERKHYSVICLLNIMCLGEINGSSCNSIPCKALVRRVVVKN